MSSVSGTGLSESVPVDVIQVARLVVDAARREWPDRIVPEAGLEFHPVLLYTETHFALSALLLFFLDGRDTTYLDLAESRLRLWNAKNGPTTFFNAMAICLAAIVLKRSGAIHTGLQSILSALISRTSEHRDVAYNQWCGNNAYLQQVAVDMVLLPLAREEAVTEQKVQYLLGEFRRFRTPEGFFFDLPRVSAPQEHLHPPTYIMKMLFLAGVCHELHPRRELRDLFFSGMTAALPLLSREGTLSYFGRTDNSPFGTGLTIFNLRKAARLSENASEDYIHAARRAERQLATFPRTPSGMLQCNLFSDAMTPSEVLYSRDDYAFVGQYSLSACAYALLGCHWYPLPDAPAGATGAPGTGVARSNDLGVVKISTANRELIVRTRSEMTSRDRRYLGPTILRYEEDGRLLVGAVSRTVSSDRAVRRGRSAGPGLGVLTLLRDRFSSGVEQLDVTSVGFLPVIRRGSIDYVPSECYSLHVSENGLNARFRMVKFFARGVYPMAIELRGLILRNIRWVKPVQYVPPPMARAADGLELERTIRLEQTGCMLEDRISGPLRGSRAVFSTRGFPGASTVVSGLRRTGSMIGWGSDGRQAITLYETRASGTEIRYTCEIKAKPASEEA